MSRPAETAFEWIDDARAFEEFVDHAQAFDRYYIDTEFHRERTYFPQLALVQIAVGGRIALIDPLVVDPRGLRRLFEGRGTAVFHAAQQDLDVFSQVCGFVPSRILDTQLCAGFLGFSQPSLTSLVQSFLGIGLPKGDRLSDWLQRPLTPDQKRYAASDVAHLEELTSLILTQLHEKGRLGWASDACEELRTRPTGPGPSTDAWLRVKDVRTLKGRARWVAREVARWREERAMSQDLPVRFVLSDMAILGIAQRAPRTVEDLGQCRGVDARQVRGKFGTEILEAIDAGVRASASGDLALPAPEAEELDRSLRPAVTLVSAWVTELARQSRLDASLLGTRKDIVDLLSNAPEARLARGWRAEIVGRDLEDLVAGRKALTFSREGSDGGLRLVDVAGTVTESPN